MRLRHIPAVPGIYRILDVEAGRFYVGSSVNLRHRWHQHAHRLERGTHPNPILQAAWTTDRARLVYEVVEQLSDASREQLLAAEQSHLDRAGAHRACMNVLMVAGSPVGRKRSAETRARMAAAQRGKKASPEARAKMRAAKLGGKLTEEHKRKVGDAGRGRTYVRTTEPPRLTLRTLSDDRVRALRADRAAGMSYSKLSTVYGLTRASIQRIVARKTYAEVSDAGQ